MPERNEKFRKTGLKNIYILFVKMSTFLCIQLHIKTAFSAISSHFKISDMCKLTKKDRFTEFVAFKTN